jgi:hypothetical protein
MDSSAHMRAVAGDTGIQESLRWCIARVLSNAAGPDRDERDGLTGTVGIGVGASRPEKSLDVGDDTP